MLGQNIRTITLLLTAVSTFWAAGNTSSAQGILGQMADELTEASVSGTILDIRGGRIRVKTEKGVALVEQVPRNMNIGLNMQISVTGSEKPSWLPKGAPIFVTGTVDKRNKFTAPVDELFLFAPNAQTEWGFVDEPEEIEGDERPVSLSATVISVKEDKVIARFPLGRTTKRVEIPFEKNAMVQINSSNLNLARPGDAITATGYTIKDPMMMALNITVNRKATKPKGNGVAGKKTGKGKIAKKQGGNDQGKKVDGKKLAMDPKGKAKPAKGKQVAAKKGEGKNAEDKKGEAKVAGKSKPKESPKRLRLRPGRALIINKQ